MTNRKSHTRFRLVPKSTTLDNLEEPLPVCTLFQNVSFGAHHENLNEDTPMLSKTLISGNIRFMQIFAVVPGEGASNDSG